MKPIRHLYQVALLITALAASPWAAAQPAGPTIYPEFHAALRSGNVQQLRAVLEAGAVVNARDAQGNTPLMYAAVYGDLASMKLLLQRGAQVNVTNLAGATPLHRAAFDFEKTRLLVERGANVNVPSALGNTALMLAARPANSHRTVEFLLAHGAQVNATNNWGGNALMAAAASGDEASVRLLLQHGAIANAQPAADPVSFVFGGGRSALMWAAFHGDAAILRRLLAAGAEVNGEGFLGTPLAQAAWFGQTTAAQLLVEKGADVNRKSHGDSFAPLHWAAAQESGDAATAKLLLAHGANPNLAGGEQVDAFLDVDQTPLMQARRRGDSPVLKALQAAGAVTETIDEGPEKMAPPRELPSELNLAAIRAAVNEAVVPLQETSIFSKQSFVNHASKQDCTSCHQQHLPLAALGAARKIDAAINREQEQQLVAMVKQGELKNSEVDWQALFHPDVAYSKGYTLFGYAVAGLPADELTDATVHHLAVAQAGDGRWYANLPRPPLDSSDVGATALSLHALQKYPLPGRQGEFAKRVRRARAWLAEVKARNNDERVFQILGLAWAGDSAESLRPLAKQLLAEQRADGGWAQLPGLKSDAYASAQAVYALQTAAKLSSALPEIDRGRRWLLAQQLADGTWYVRRRAFPFQPTMKSGFPHGHDSWISAAASSWAVLALSQSEPVPDATAAVPMKIAGQSR